eukprot:Lankesteria_metandrocarpae@DN1957_c0_g1_i1.p1
MEAHQIPLEDSLLSGVRLEQPNQSLRDGHRHEAHIGTHFGHPVQQAVDKKFAERQEANRLAVAGRLYGTHMPMRLLLERNAVAMTRRLPGIQSSHLSLDVALGLEDDIDFSNYLNIPTPEDPLKNKSVHEAIERLYNL